MLAPRIRLDINIRTLQVRYCGTIVFRPRGTKPAVLQGIQYLFTSLPMYQDFM